MLFWFVIISKWEYILTKEDFLQNLGFLFYVLLMDNFYL